ncbi:MAG: hypothetical protein AMXMBFR82_07100 [Candidatus Hydrogenedentota bacterium]
MKFITRISVCMTVLPFAVGFSHAQPVDTNSSSEHLALTQQERDEVRSSLDRVTAEVFADAIAKDYESKNLNISPFLETIVLDESESVSTRTQAIFLLGQLEENSSTDVFIDIIDSRLKQEMMKDDIELIRCSMIALGWQGDKRALELLFKLASKEFWAQVTPDGIACADCDTIQEGNVITYLRKQALSALAGSGTDEAIKAFATGEGLPADLSRSFPHRLDIAVYRKCDIIAIPDKLSKLDQDERSQYWDTWSWIQKEFGSREEIYQRFRNESGQAPSEPEG